MRLWDVASKQELAALEGHTNGVTSVSYSPDGQTLASASLDQTVRLWDVASKQELAILEGHTDRIRSVSYSPDGQTLASASLDQTVRLWDASSKQELAILEGHTDRVTSVSYSPDGQTLASGEGAFGDYTIRLWDVATRQEIAILQGHRDGLLSVSHSPDGQTLASASWDETILLWDMSPYVTLPTAVAAASPSLPAQTELLANYPNPFNSRTQLTYRLAAPGVVRLELYNALGQWVRTLVDQFQVAGEYQVPWDARDGQGAAASSGVYVTRLYYPGGMQTRRLLYLK